MAYAHNKHIATIMSTNLNKPLTPQMAEDIIKSGLDVMIVSLDGVTQEVYEKYRVGGRLDRVLDNVKVLVQKKRELGYSTPHIEWQFIVMRQNEHQIEEARKLGHDLGVDSVVLKPRGLPPWYGRRRGRLNSGSLASTRSILRDDPFYKPYQEDGRRCWRLWRSAVVNWDGGLAPCCYLTDKSEDFGDVNHSSIQKIWNNDNYTTARVCSRTDIPPRSGLAAWGAAYTWKPGRRESEALWTSSLIQSTPP